VTKAKAIMALAFLLSFAAGGAVGWIVGRAAPREPSGSRLARELGLTPEQSDKMRKIWTEVMQDSGRQFGERRQALQKQRDEAVRALLTEQQKPQYEEVTQDYTRKQAELSKEREKLFQTAVEKTKEILTPEQRVKYEELLKNRSGRGWRGRGGDGPQRTEDHPAPQSGTQGVPGIQ
jgi:Spy/CpxP family protein refolding chaperone